MDESRAPMSAPMRLALFLPNFAGGGAERVMITLAGAFARAGHRVDLIVANAEGPYAAELPPGVRVVDLRAGRVVKALVPLVRYLRRERPQALLSTLTHANAIAVAAGRLSGVRVFAREAITLSAEGAAGTTLRGRLVARLARRIYQAADTVVAPSRGVAEDMARRLRLAPERLRVIYNPVVDERLFELGAQPAAHPWAREGGVPLVVGAGRLSTQKDFATLIRAFRRVRDHGPARLLILGEGEERAELERLVTDLALNDDVALPGFVANPFAVMARAAVFVLSSRFEGLPNALIQALALGAPLVSTDCPSGPREILTDSRFGTLVPVGEAPAMAEAILARLRLPHDAGAARAAAAPFHVREITRQYLALFAGGPRGRESARSCRRAVEPAGH